jgi:hypothetical protein
MNNERKNLQEAVDAVDKNGSVAAAAKALNIPRKTLSGRYNKALDKGYVSGTPMLSPDQEIGLDSKLKTVVREKRELQNKYNELLKLFEAQTDQSNFIETFNNNLNSVEYEKIKILPTGTQSESTAIILCSDLHYEETVDPKTVDNLNEYNIKIAEKRFHKIFQNGLKLIEMSRSKSNIKTLVLWLGGDLINGYIHPEFVENNEMSPIEASIDVFKLCVSAIDFLVENGGFEKIIVITNIGNHGRTTEKRRISTAAENSYEWLIYNFLSSHYEKSPIVQFKLSKGYFNWLSIYGYDLRFHHGENIRYAGGVGGISIPLNKAIAQWNQAKTAYLDVMGHWHQGLSSKNFIVNSSIIGYNSYAVSIKASFEKPQQFFFLMHPRYGRTIQAPIFVE